MKSKSKTYCSILFRLHLLFCLFWGSFSFSQGLVLNEVMMKNDNYQSIDGDYHDWIEIYNNSSTSIQLSEYYLSDKRNNLQKWNFPDSMLAPQQFLILAASNLDIVTSNFVHTNFTLSSNSETVYLSLNGLISDSLSPKQTPTNLSFGRVMDGQEEKGRLILPSFGSSNNANNAITPSVTLATFDQAFNLYLNDLQGDSIFYTTNGSDPSPNAILYSDSIWLTDDIISGNNLSSIPTSTTQDLLSYKAWEQPQIPVKKCHVLKYATFKNGVQTSPIYAQTFIPLSNMGELNVVHIITDSLHLFDYNSGIYVPGIHYQSNNPEWTGNFCQRGVNWAKPAHINYISKTGESNLNQAVEIKISGGKTRHAGQKSLGITAKSALSDKFLRYNFFPDKKPYLEKAISLKTTFGDWGTQSMMKDILVHAMSEGLQVKTLDYEFVEVYFNGEFWGIQVIRERNSSSNLGLIYGDEDLDINVLNPSSLVLDHGSVTEFENLKEFIALNDLSIPSNYNFVASKIDMENFIDNYAIEMFFANYDWPVNNNKIWKSNAAPDKWRHLLFDLDAAFPVSDYNMLNHVMRNDPNVFWPNPSNSTLLFRSFIMNSEFRNNFMSRFDVLLKSSFSSENTIQKLEEIKNILEPNVPAQIDRWGYPDSFESWSSDIEGFIDFLKERPCIMADQLNTGIPNVQFKITCNLDYDDNNAITIFPNPTNADLKMKFAPGVKKDLFIQLTSAEGKILKEFNFKNHLTSQVVVLDLKDYKKGSYFLKMNRGGQRFIEKVIKL